MDFQGDEEQQQNNEDQWPLDVQEQPEEPDAFFGHDGFVSTWQMAIEDDPPMPEPDPIVCPVDMAIFELAEGDPYDELLYNSVIRPNWSYIRTHYNIDGPVQKVYIIRLRLYSVFIVQRLMHWLRQIFIDQNGEAFRLNFSFSYALRRIGDNDDDAGEDNEPRVRAFISSANAFTFFEQSPMITDQESLDQLVIERLDEDDLKSFCLTADRPSTQWVFDTFLAVSIYVTRVANQKPIGTGDEELTNADLPDYIIHNPNVLTLLNDHANNNRPRKNIGQLCFFRCLAVFRTNNLLTYETEAKSLFKEYMEYTRKWCADNNEATPTWAKYNDWLIRNIRAFPGVRMEELHLLEKCFQQDIQVWTVAPDLEGDDQARVKECKARVIRYSLRQYRTRPVLHLLQYPEDIHYMLIQSVKGFARRYQCECCGMLFEEYKRLQWHKKRQKNELCERGQTKRSFPGGSAGPRLTLFDELAVHTGIRIPGSLRYYPFRIGFDFETYCASSPRPQEQQQLNAQPLLPAGFPLIRATGWWNQENIQQAPKAQQGETPMQRFLRENWNKFRPNHMNIKSWRVQACSYDIPAALPDHRDIAFPEIAVRHSLLSSYAQLRQWLVYALSRPSVEMKATAECDFCFIICVQQQVARGKGPQPPMEAIQTVRWFQDYKTEGHSLALTDWEASERHIEQALGDEAEFNRDLHTFMRRALGTDRAFYLFLAFECQFEIKSLAYSEHELVPLSVVVKSNIPGYKATKILINEGLDNEQESADCLIDRFVDYALECAEKADKIIRAHLRMYIKDLKDQRKFYYEKALPYIAASSECEDQDDNNDDERERTIRKREAIKERLLEEGWTEEQIEEMRQDRSAFHLLDNLYNRICVWCRQCPILGFNSSSFDVCLIRYRMLPRIINRWPEANQWLDAMAYTSKCNYSTFLKSWGVDEVKKLRFPYQAIRSVQDLYKPGVPDRTEWSNWLAGERDVTDAEWMDIQTMWSEGRYQTPADLLVDYNSADVTGLMLALDKIAAFWKDNYQLDAFTAGISLPGLAYQSMLKSLPPFTILSLPNQQNDDIQQMFKSALIAGPSIIFHRYAEQGVTKVPSSELVGNIMGFDVNSLYPSSLCQPLPVGVGLGYSPIVEQQQPQAQPLHAATDANEPGPSHRSDDNSFLDAFLDCVEEDEEEAPPPLLTLENTYFESHPMERYWRGQCEWLAWSTEHEYRAPVFKETIDEQGKTQREYIGRVCANHFPLGKFTIGREIRIGSGLKAVPVDGVCADCLTIQQFHGCLYHAHDPKDCLDPKQAETLAKLDQDIVAERRERTARVHKYLLEENMMAPNHKVKVMWECEWNRVHKAHSREIREFCIEKFPYFPRKKSPVSGQDLVEGVKAKWFTGFLTVDVEVKRDCWEKYARFPTIFNHREIGRDDIRPPMLDYVMQNDMLKRPQRALVSSLRAQRWTVLTPYLKDLIENRDVIVTKVYEGVWFPLRDVCQPFFDSILQRRLQAQKQNNVGLSTALKLLANSVYGRCCLNKDNQVECHIVGTQAALNLAADPRFRHLQTIQEGSYYQVTLAKKRIVYDVPTQLAVSCLNYAKMSVVEFTHDFVLRFMCQSCQLLLMDTDSLYIAVKGKTLEESLDEPQRDMDAFQKAKCHFLDDRFPGKWKLEQSDITCCVALASKTYCLQKDDKTVAKAKGVQNRINSNALKMEAYKRALFGREIIYGENRGMKMGPRKIADAEPTTTTGQETRMHHYRLSRRALTYMYVKRHVCGPEEGEEGVETKPLEMCQER